MHLLRSARAIQLWSIATFFFGKDLVYLPRGEVISDRVRASDGMRAGCRVEEHEHRGSLKSQLYIISFNVNPPDFFQHLPT